MSSTRFENFNELHLRVITGFIAGSVVLVSLIIGAPVFNIILLLCAFIAASEVQTIVSKQSMPTIPAFAALTLILAATLKSNEVLAFGLAGTALWALFTPHGHTLALGGLIVGIPLSLITLIRGNELGFAWCVMIMGNTWTTDSMAYFGGRKYGRTPLAPAISPKKTVEGAVIGIIVGALVGIAIGSTLELSIIELVVMNLCITVAVVLGDLTESKIKRHYHIKDSGAILPGHGGILDRIDGLLAAILIAALFAL